MGSMFSRPAERLAEDAAAYIDLKVDELKLRTAKGLSVTLNRLIISILFLTLGSIVLMALAFGGVLLLGDLIGSYAAGAFIVAGFFLLLMVLLYFVRNKLFLNGFVKLFVGLFFENDGPEEGGQAGSTQKSKILKVSMPHVRH